ncbi:hypothetical protein BDK51DRAFT_33420 [Blyttiomyces helicus]|uniref:G-patch domain-containing protein n=1 Tax=Blyttiomyces helicus TaxID=388810 RepID=A0A4P9VXJ3_9FUNG|nr:hypothetical protein BDK51DRAFT_33420 [Blyttiomyces helicus]|eukprot:RKO83635.1 hypothetical protein BDK51DRAFT_33420 [Blyttiomyces helicus]
MDDEPRPSFAQSQLQKYGWEHGKGLGKNEEGISRAISVGIKNDNKGLGAKSDEWTFQWWDHVFNRASQSIKIEKDDEGDVKVQTNSKADREKSAKKLLYGSFVKSVAGTSDDEDKDYSVKVTDAELLAACEGRTARKGARAHQPGKLMRVDKRLAGAALAGLDEEAVAGVVSEEDDATVEQKSKKKKRVREEGGEEKPKKEKRKRRAVAVEEEGAGEGDAKPDDEVVETKAERKERKRLARLEKEAAAESVPAPEAETKEERKERKRKARRQAEAEDAVPATPEEDVFAASGKTKKEKKRRSQPADVVVPTESDAEAPAVETETKKKKKKAKTDSRDR